jgi:hypothetical protein
MGLLLQGPHTPKGFHVLPLPFPKAIERPPERLFQFCGRYLLASHLAYCSACRQFAHVCRLQHHIARRMRQHDRRQAPVPQAWQLAASHVTSQEPLRRRERLGCWQWPLGCQRRRLNCQRALAKARAPPRPAAGGRAVT